MKKALLALSLFVVSVVVSAAEQNLTEGQNVTSEQKSTSEAGIVSRACGSVVNGVFFVKDGVFFVYDSITGTVEKFTPNIILGARDSVRNLISSYPLTAVALTAYVSVQYADYIKETLGLSGNSEEDEDDSL